MRFLLRKLNTELFLSIITSTPIITSHIIASALIPSITNINNADVKMGAVNIGAIKALCWL